MLTKVKFWNIIGNVANSYELEQLLLQLSKDEIISFHVWFKFYVDYAEREKLWCAVDLLTGGVSDDRFNDFCNWLVLSGYESYQLVVKKADNLRHISIGFDESVGYTAAHALEKKFGIDIYDIDKEKYKAKLPKLKMPKQIDRLSYIDYNNGWVRKENVMKKLCPELYALVHN